MHEDSRPVVRLFEFMDAARSLQAMTSDSREPECATLPYSVLFSVTSTVILQTLKQALGCKTGTLKCLSMVHAVMQTGFVLPIKFKFATCIAACAFGLVRTTVLHQQVLRVMKQNYQKPKGTKLICSDFCKVNWYVLVQTIEEIQEKSLVRQDAIS